MKLAKIPIIVLIYLFTPFSLSYSTTVPAAKKEKKNEILNKIHALQVPFIENNKSIKYYAKTFVGTIFINKIGEILYSLPDLEEEKTTMVF